MERDDAAPPAIRPVRHDELALLPDLEAAAGAVFEPLGTGPLPGPSTPEQFGAALVVLVAGDPPVGLCRIDGIAPDRALLRAGCAWAADKGYPEITLATYRDVPWNGPFYASEGFVARGSVDEFLRAHGLAPEEPVMSRFGARVLMSRSL